MNRIITRIFVHCSAGFGDVESIKRYWKNVLKWKSPGYHRIIDLDANTHSIAEYNDIVNGVKYYNSTGIHISYIGGVDPNNYKIAKDTRTEEQKAALICEIKNVLEYLKEFQDISKIEIIGHRDISPDRNKNGIVDTWERIKECPSFDAIPEYKNILKEVLLMKALQTDL